MRKTGVFVAIGLTVAAGCTGDISPPPNGSSGAVGCSPSNPACDEAASCLGDVNAVTALAQQPLRRLSATEYHNTVRDLFGGVPYDPTELVPVLTAGGFENYVVNTRQVSDRDVEAFDRTVSGIAARASADQDFLARHGCPSPGDEGACVRGFVSAFGLRALRRPLTADEEATYVALADEVRGAVDLPGGLETVIAAMLMTPEFLYRVEAPGQRQASPYEVASRVSYLLWQSMPDDTLFAAAAANALDTPAALEAQARRLLADARATEAMVDFHRQWFRFARMDEDKYAAKSPTLFPEWTPELRTSIREEIERFVRFVAEDDTSFSRLLIDRTAFLDEGIAALYGVTTPGPWEEVELPVEQRAGILTRANFLAGTGIAGHGSPVHRGIFVYESLLCGELGGVPDDVDTSLPEGADDGMTTRQAYEELTAPSVCQGCHAAVNPIGFSFEHYTSTGAWRTMDSGQPVDATGQLSASDQLDPVDGAVELSERLAVSEVAHDCAAEKWTTYMLGRHLEEGSQDDVCFTERIQEAFWASGGDMRELLVTLVTQPEFVGGAR